MSEAAKRDWFLVLVAIAIALAIWLKRNGTTAATPTASSDATPAITPDYLTYNIPPAGKTMLQLPDVAPIAYTPGALNLNLGSDSYNYGGAGPVSVSLGAQPPAATCGCSGGAGDGLSSTVGSMMRRFPQTAKALTQQGAANILTAFPHAFSL